MQLCSGQMEANTHIYSIFTITYTESAPVPFGTSFIHSFIHSSSYHEEPEVPASLPT